MLRQDLLRAKAAALSLSVVDIHKKTGISTTTIRSVLNDPNYNVTLSTLERITETLDLTVHLVLDETSTVEAVL
jgi:DNA-binding Xre family transcriptional regulator